MTDDTSLQKFLTEAAGHRLLTAREEKALGRRAQKSDLTARNELVLCNIRLVVSVARYYRNRGLPMDDVVQNGVIGLNRAAEKFDPERGIRFSTYATLWIKQAIQRGLISGAPAIRLPSTVSSSRAKVRAAQSKYPDADHVFIADFLDLDVRDVERALGAAEVVTSIDRSISTDGDSHSILDVKGDPYANDNPYDLVEDDISDELREALTALSSQGPNGKMSRLVLEMHFGLGDKQPMRTEAIAAALSKRGTTTSVNTVKTRRAEGLAFLSHRLDHHR